MCHWEFADRHGREAERVMFGGYVTIAINVKHLAKGERLELTNSKKEEKPGRGVGVRAARFL